MTRTHASTCHDYHTAVSRLDGDAQSQGRIVWRHGRPVILGRARGAPLKLPAARTGDNRNDNHHSSRNGQFRWFSAHPVLPLIPTMFYIKTRAEALKGAFSGSAPKVGGR